MRRYGNYYSCFDFPWHIFDPRRSEGTAWFIAACMIIAFFLTPVYTSVTSIGLAWFILGVDFCSAWTWIALTPYTAWVGRVYPYIGYSLGTLFFLAIFRTLTG